MEVLVRRFKRVAICFFRSVEKIGYFWTNFCFSCKTVERKKRVWVLRPDPKQPPIRTKKKAAI